MATRHHNGPRVRLQSHWDSEHNMTEILDLERDTDGTWKIPEETSKFHKAVKTIKKAFWSVTA